MSVSASKSTSCESSRKRKKAEEEGIQRKRPSTASQQQVIDTKDVGDAQGREDGESSLNIQGGDVQSRKITDPPSISMFSGASNFQVGNTDIITVVGDATFIRFGEGPFTEVQRDLIGDYIAKHIVLPAINENSKKHVLTQLVILLPRAEAVFNDYQTKKKSGPCFEGTRVALLKEMADWITGQDESRMYILSGLAGIGKSTVAYTIASRAADLNLLGATFFFSRDEADRNNAKKLFTTIAYQLCVYDERFAEAIGDALQTERGSAAVTKDPLEQLQALILDPLRSIAQSRTRPILVIVDALDECCEDDVYSVFTALSQLVEGLPTFKVILTTRPQPLFDNLLSTNHGCHKLFRLQDIEDKIVDGDIRLYLKYNLSLKAVQALYPRRQWCANDEEIDTLVRATGRLFIIASTSVRYILDKWASNPAAQMKELLQACAQNRTPLQDLDRFYAVILQSVVPASCDNYNIVNRYQSVLGTIIHVQHPISISTLAYLIDIDTEDIRTILDRLQSVILLGDDDVPRVYHKSFPDYLTDKVRCKEFGLRIDPKICHRQIAKRCFEIANGHLKYNILGLGTPARFMDNRNGLEEDGITEEKLQEKIPQQLCYACIYWVIHLEAANIESSNVLNGLLDKFVNEHVLHWFEVLSLTGKLDVAHRIIRTALKLLPASSDLHRLLSDALRFISKFYEIINTSALHTYYSALPFSPTDSLLYRRYIKEAEHGICDVEGGPWQWNAIVADLSHGEKLEDAAIIKFSLNSDMLVYFSEHLDYEPQGKLKIWDAFTGTPISTIQGYRFAISNDFCTVVSGEENVITAYNLDGSATGIMVTTSSKIKTLALSSETNRIAALLYDNTVCLWKSANGNLIGSFDGADCSGTYWRGLEFSRSGRRLIYSATNGVVKLLDGTSGIFIADLQCGLWNKLELSADSSRIASLSEDRGLILWNSDCGGLIAAACVLEECFMLAISMNGSLVVTSGSNGNDVTLWSENYGQMTKVKVLEFHSPFSVAFSQDNLLAICDFSGVKIYNIETCTISTLISRSSSGSATFSPDGTRLACGSLLFDAQAINTSSSPSRKTCAMALSHDCSQLACGFHDGTVELWGTSPAMRQIASHKYHLDTIMVVVFGPDSRLFASSGLERGTINLWNGGDGSFHGAIDHGSSLWTVALSNSVLIAGGKDKITLWDLGTLSLMHTFEISPGNTVCKASISDDSDLAAIAFHDNSINLVDLTNHTTAHIGTLDFHDYGVQSLEILPDKSHLVAHSYRGEFRSLDLVNKCIANEQLLEHLIQLPRTPLWHNVPVCVYWPSDRRAVTVLCSPSQSPVPLLWVPTDRTSAVNTWALGSSLIALGCHDGRIILLRLRTNHVGQS